MSIANYLTFFRLVVTPMFFWIYSHYGQAPLFVAITLFIVLTISEISDFLDGFIARKYDQVTDLGKILDPMADSLARIGVFLIFTLPPVNLPILLVFIFLYRDSMISTLRTLCALRGFALAARPSGKIKAIVQASATFFTIAALIAHSMALVSGEFVNLVATIGIGIAAVVSVLAGIEYVVSNQEHINKAVFTYRR